jgi:hypothetical protein
VLDEFHERSLDADTALALALDCQAWTRPDLRWAGLDHHHRHPAASSLQCLKLLHSNLGCVCVLWVPFGDDVTVECNSGRSCSITRHWSSIALG